MLPVQEYDSAVTAYETARAALAVTRGDLAVAQADLDEAEVNLGYTTIRSPVKGVILDRRVNLGQSVAGGSASRHVRDRHVTWAGWRSGRR